MNKKDCNRKIDNIINEAIQQGEHKGVRIISIIPLSTFQKLTPL